MSVSRLYTGYEPGLVAPRPSISFELFPPRDASGQLAGTGPAWAGVDRLICAAPDFVSVTYQAGGSRRDSRDTSVRVLMRVAEKHPGLPAMAHLTCTSGTRGDLTMLVRLLLHAGIRDFLALRGDGPAIEMDRAVDLVRLIRQVAAETLPDGVGTGPGGSGINTCTNPADYVSIGVAAYPAATGQRRANDVAALTEKRAAGADLAISQVFYQPSCYASLVAELARADVDIPILPGIVPLTSLKRLRMLERLAHVPVPAELAAALSVPDPEQRLRNGIGASLDLIRRILGEGAPGIHLYSFNRTRPSLDLIEYIRAGCRADASPDVEELMHLTLKRITPAP